MAWTNWKWAVIAIDNGTQLSGVIYIAYFASIGGARKVTKRVFEHETYPWDVTIVPVTMPMSETKVEKFMGVAWSDWMMCS